jgi:hypothetical protein
VSSLNQIRQKDRAEASIGTSELALAAACKPVEVACTKLRLLAQCNRTLNVKVKAQWKPGLTID